MTNEEKRTGYPSIDRPWLKYFNDGAEQKALNVPTGKTAWDVIEEKLHQHETIPAIEYFGRAISRPEFINMVYEWARVFKALGVKEDEVIPYYGPFFPDVGAMVFALNMIGACPYFIKLAISPKALAEETADSTIAIVYDDMWQNVSSEFSKDRFKTVLVVSATDAMPATKRHIISMLGKAQKRSGVEQIPHNEKFIRVPKAKKLAKTYTGETRVPFVPNRASFITSSSGTTVGGVVKGVVATNESTIAQLLMEDAAEVSFFPKDRCLNHFPPTASTSLNCLFLIPLYRGCTVVMDPRVSSEDFYRQVTTLRPNVIIHTGSAWEVFFTRIEEEQRQGKQFDLSFATAWIVGGEGADKKKFLRWKGIMKAAKAADVLVSGYGSSELFSAAVGEQAYARCPFDKKIISVGIPYAGMTIGVFDTKGKECGLNQRGELWIKSKTAMKEYYKKPELTAQTKVDGWIHTGDLAEIDENGFVYVWGRLKDTVTLQDGREIYLFDIANKCKENKAVDDVIILPMPKENGGFYLVAHVVWEKQLSETDKKEAITVLNRAVAESFPQEARIAAYAEHDGMLPYSPTTLKKDKNKLITQRDGYVQVIDGRLQKVRFEQTSEQPTYVLAPEMD